MDLLAAAANTIRHGQRGLFVIAGLVAIWFVIDYFFGRVKGGTVQSTGDQGAPKRTSLA
jgi:hypothetical protein